MCLGRVFCAIGLFGCRGLYHYQDCTSIDIGVNGTSLLPCSDGNGASPGSGIDGKSPANGDSRGASIGAGDRGDASIGASDRGDASIGRGDNKSG